MNILELVNDDRSIVLNNQVVSLVYKSPIFNKNDGTFSYDLELDLTPEVNEIFGYPSISTRKEFIGKSYSGWSLLYCSTLILEGNIDIIDVNDYSLSISIGFGKGHYHVMSKDKKLHQLNILEKVNLGEDPLDYFNPMISATYPDYKFCLPTVYNDADLHMGTIYIHSRYINGQNLYTDTFQYQPAIDVTHRNIITPFIFLRSVFEGFAKFSGFNLVEDFFNDGSDLNTLALFSNVVEKFEKNGNNWILDLNKYLPQIEWKEFEKTIHETFNTVIITTHFGNEMKLINKSDVLNSNAVNRFDYENLALVDSREPVDVTNGYHYFYDISSANSHFKELVKDIFSPESKYVYKGTITDTEINNVDVNFALDNYMVYDVWFNTDDDCFWSFEPYEDNGATVYFKKVSINEARIKTNEDDYTEVKQKISPIKQEVFDLWKLNDYDTTNVSYAFGYYDVPRIDHKKVVNPLEEKLEKVLLLFYRGNVGGKPYANTDFTNSNGFTVGTKSLHLDYMYQNYWKQWLDWYYSNREKVTLILPITHKDLHSLTYEEPYEFTELGITGFIDSFEVDLKTGEKPYAKVSLFLR